VKTFTKQHKSAILYYRIKTELISILAAISGSHGGEYEDGSPEIFRRVVWWRFTGELSP
jgi:hypothetical protein